MSIETVSLGNSLYAGNLQSAFYANTLADIDYSDIESLVKCNSENSSTEPVFFGMAGLLRCAYSSQSTQENPLVDVYAGDEIYTVDVNKVDPKAATNIEMFAYCEHMDKEGLMPNAGMGSYATLMFAQDMAMYNGFIADDGTGVFDWTEIAESVKDIVYKSGDMLQYLRINAIMDVIDRHLGMDKSNDEITVEDRNAMHEVMK